MTPPVMPSGLSLGTTTADDGLYSQSLMFRSGPVSNNARTPETEGEIHFPVGVTIVAIASTAAHLNATDTTWGIWDGTAPNIYTASSRAMEASDTVTQHVDADDGHEYIVFRTNMNPTPYTDEFRVLIDYGEDFPAGLSLTVHMRTGNDINLGDRDGGLAIPPNSDPMVQVLVPLTACASADSCFVDGVCTAAGEADPTNDCMVCDPDTAVFVYSPVAAGDSCDDGLFCTMNDACDGAGACVGTARLCPDDANVCASAVCDDVADACVNVNAADGTVCPDGVCSAGACSACIDDVDGGPDSGCDAALPACVGTGDDAACTECDADTPCATGVCSADNTCVECTDDAHCGGDDVCDLATNSCELCAADSMMSIDPGCDASAPACLVTGATRECVACTDDSQCTDGVCDPDTNSCATCLADGSGCAAPTPVCLDPDTAPVCVECGVDGDCASGVCQTDNTCAQCGSDDDCAGDSVCESNACVACRDTSAGIDDGCTAAAPSCVGTDGAEMCVECASDAECAVGVCDLTTFACVACLEDATADEDHGCDAAAPVCDTSGTDPVCVACVDDATGSDADSGCEAAAPLCDTSGASPVCVPCIDDGTTTLGCDTDAPFCRDDVDPIVCVACLVDGDCDAGEVCGPSGECTTSCSDNDDCADPDAPVCEPTSATCVECAQDSECTDGVCSDEFTCVECVGNDDCTDGVCSNNVCVGCLADTDCGEDEVCHSDNTCGPECATDADCADGVCLEQACVACAVDSDCADGNACVDNACVVTGCSGDADCPASTPACQPDGTCVACTRDEHCANGEVCVDTACEQGAETPECTIDSDCNGGATCKDGSCVVDLSNDEDELEEEETGSAYQLTGGCSTSDASPAGSLAGFGLLGLALVALRRRR